MTISVRNSIAQQTSANAFVTTLTPLDRDDAPLVWPYNPSEWTIEISPQWNTRNALATEKDESDWQKNAPRVLSFEQLFRSRNLGRASPVSALSLDDLQTFLDKFEDFATTRTVRTNQPTLCVLALGAREFVVHIEPYRVEVQQQDAAGNALVARVSFRFTENVE